jgi:archaellin
MIVFIALILVAAVASTIIIKTAEELQQNAENTSSDTRNEISGKVTVSDVFVKAAANPLCVDHSGAVGAPLVTRVRITTLTSVLSRS